jgi:hypothetical protein
LSSGSGCRIFQSPLQRLINAVSVDRALVCIVVPEMELWCAMEHVVIYSMHHIVGQRSHGAAATASTEAPTDALAIARLTNVRRFALDVALKISWPLIVLSC